MLGQRLSRTLQTAARQQRPCIRIRQPTFSTSPFISSRSCAPTASQRLVGRRWYSETAEVKKEDGVEEKPAEEAQKEDPVQKELEAKKKEVIDVTDRLKRSIADYRNLQEQTKREVRAAKDFALQSFSRDLLEPVDNLDRALATVPADKLTSENPDLVSLHDGLRMSEAILMQTLKKHGLERIDPSVESEKFDPNRHEAVFQTPMKDKQDGTVFHTQQKGYILNGRVLRAPKVGVVRNS